MELKKYQLRVLDEGVYENWKHELTRLLEAPVRA